LGIKKFFIWASYPFGLQSANCKQQPEDEHGINCGHFYKKIIFSWECSKEEGKKYHERKALEAEIGLEETAPKSGQIDRKYLMCKMIVLLEEDLGGRMRK
jgi:hypothetical protein